MDARAAEELIRRLAAAQRAIELYSPAHPLVRRGLDALGATATASLQKAPAVVIGFIADAVIVDDVRLPRGSASFVGFTRAMKEREVEKITLSRGVTRDEISTFVQTLAEKDSPIPVSERLTTRGVRNVTVGKITVADESEDGHGI